MTRERVFFGKYRGVVTANVDPAALGRIKARVPDVYGELESGWAMPCAPFAGHHSGFCALPSIGGGVWIEFEHGDPDYPIWAGCWWGSAAERPPELSPSAADKVLLKTKGGHTILLDDTPGSGGITIQANDGKKVVIDQTGIEISNGAATVKMTAGRVSVNGGALEID